MALATFVVFLYGLYPNMKDGLQGFSVLWGQLLSVTTFTLTFFLNQSYGLWRKCYDYSRRLQGRLNDLGMTLAAHATRTKPSSPDIPSTYTPQSRQALELVSRYVRVFNLLTYASFTRSHRPILTPRGMRRLVERGILTPREREILSDAEVPATQRHNAVLIWLIRLFLEGRETGVFEGGMGFEQQFMEKCHVIRSQYGAIGDELQGRMPLAYAHIVQILLDVVLWMYPFMALSTGMAWGTGIIGTGLLTMFYQGLFDLAKQFLDPYDNENYGKGDDPLVIDTLIAETNAGSVRWMNSFQQQPWNRQLLNDGELYDSILPLRGYSVEDLAEMEAQEEKEQQERELAINEIKRKEEEKARQRAEQLLTGHVASIKNRTSASLVGEKWNGTAMLTPAGEELMNINAEEGMVSGNKTLMEVSGGEVVTTSSLLPAGSAVLGQGVGADSESDRVNTTVVEMGANKVLTLADGTLVTSDDTLTINTTTAIAAPAESNATDTIQRTSEKTTMNDVPVVGEEEPSHATEVPPLFDGTNDVAWDQLGATPNFEESISEMETYKASLPSSFLPPSAPLYDTSSDIIGNKFDANLNGEDDDIFKPNEIEWFDEIGPDGQEYRLSQMLADEDWFFDDEEETEYNEEDKTMTYDEFAQKATEIIEQAEYELAETKEIMSVSPGSNAEYDVTKRDISGGGTSPAASLPTRRKVMDEPEPLYDQTRLDGISQLWGAPPEVLERSIVEEDDEVEQAPTNDDIDFKNIYSLWGEGLPSGQSAALDEDERATTSPSMEGFSQLWNENLSPYGGCEVDDVEDDSINQMGRNEGASDPRQAFAGMEWWDEVSEDGKEVRLSQMLADEEYDEVMETDIESPMTFEQFAEETEKLIEQAEDERKETEAIMNAPPNANFLEPEEGDSLGDASAVEKTIVNSDKFQEMVMSLVEGNDSEDDINTEEIISDEEIGVLEMDDLPEEGESEEGGDMMGKDSSSPNVQNDDALGDSFLQSTLDLEKNVEEINGGNN